MRICIFASNYLPNLGGLERYLYNLTAELLKRKHEVVIVTSNVANYAWKEEMQGVIVYRLPCFGLLNGRFPVSKYNKEYRRIMKEVDKQKYDFLLVTPRFYVHSFFGAKYAKSRKIPALVLEHGTGHFTVNNIILDFFGRIYEHTISGLVKHYIKDFAGVSEACNQWLKHFGIHTSLVLYNTVDFNMINSIMESETTDYRKKYNVPSDGVVITYTGRMVPEKGILKLYEACKNANNKEKIYLFAAGTGELYEELKGKANKHFIPIGRLEFREVVSLLKQTDIFCLPTDFSEGFPTSVLEAVATKCYVITTKNGGSKELITDRTYGTILQENTVQELMQEIEMVSQDVELRKKVTEKTYKRMCERFTWEKTVDVFLDYVKKREK